MINLQRLYNNQITVFIISLIVFLIAATFGWVRLHYGFNFFDEGFYMTEAWRLTVGDELFQEKLRGALDMSSVINSIFFRISPNITLLKFREIQFFLTICALLIFSLALYKVNKGYWFYPLIFSLFAYTGVDTTGLIPNLSKNTYPHLFIIFHLAFLLLALRQESVALRRTYFIIAGIFLWLISFTLLSMSIVLFSPLILFYFIHKWKTDYVSFDFMDLCFIYAPILLCWTIFIAIFNKDYLDKIIPCIQLNMQWGQYYSKESLIHRIINWETAKYLIINLIYMIIFYYLLRFRKGTLLICGTILCFLMYLIIDTSFWGLVHPLFVFYSRPMWLASLLMTVYLLFLFNILWKILTQRILSEAEVISLILFIPCIILSVSNSVLTFNGLIAILWASVPAIGSISILLLSNRNVKKQPYFIKFIVLFIFFAPFYYSTAWSGWHYPYNDVAPQYATATIEQGFGKGIKTNLLYKNLYDWISANAEKYTSKDDFIISYTCTPMVYMIAKRRPALNSSWTDYRDTPADYVKKDVDSMKNNGRAPRMAVVFEKTPIIYPSEKDKYVTFEREFSFPSNDAISQYIVQNMYFINQWHMEEDSTVRCFYHK